MDDSLSKLLAVVADRGLLEPPFAPADEHARFQLYQIGLAEGDLVDVLLPAVNDEQDRALQSATLAKLLERVPSDQRQRVLAAGTGSEFLRRRADELDLLEALEPKPTLSPDDEQAIRAGSDWFQRQLVERSQHRPVFDFLARSAKTRKVRAAAALRSRELNP